MHVSTQGHILPRTPFRVAAQGTKVACGEGGCGACAVEVSRLDANSGCFSGLLFTYPACFIGTEVPGSVCRCSCGRVLPRCTAQPYERSLVTEVAKGASLPGVLGSVSSAHDQFMLQVRCGP